jgi:adenosine/AMP kinase
VSCNAPQVAIDVRRQSLESIPVALGLGAKGIEGEAEVVWRHDLLRKIGYKR